MEHPTEALSGYLDDALDAETRAAVASHLDQCARCRVELEALRGVSRLVGGIASRPLPAGFLHQLEAKRRGGSKRSDDYWLPFPARLAAFAISSLLVSLVVYDKARVMFPFRVAVSGVPEDQLRLSADDLELARAQKGEKSRAQAPGSPLAAGQGGVAAKPQTQSPTNEQLQADLEKQKARLGIRAIVPPAGQEGIAPTSALESPAAASPPSLPSDSVSPQMLKAAPPQEGQGMIFHSDVDRQAEWEKRGLTLSPPSVNYERSSLILVFAPDLSTAVEILSVAAKADAIEVRYRLFPRLENLALRAGQGGPIISYQFRTIPKTEKPVAFTRVE